jgi:hypothetical protein
MPGWNILLHFLRGRSSRERLGCHSLFDGLSFANPGSRGIDVQNAGCQRREKKKKKNNFEIWTRGIRICKTDNIYVNT